MATSSLPISLIIAAIVVFLSGLRRLSSRSTTGSTRGPLLLWFSLLFAGVVIWTWATYVRR